jgi:hypothetical protein
MNALIFHTGKRNPFYEDIVRSNEEYCPFMHEEELEDLGSGLLEEGKSLISMLR